MLIAEGFFDSLICGLGAAQIPGSPALAYSSKKLSAVSDQPAKLRAEC
jgi:hypothetical protein